ncbi:VOC family protein [Synechococcus sp. BS55D]|uniref:VOC family protein n=1 Tax=Synechococcus sp. BS55D TaxID=2055943 RepID=UPI00104058BB|nr:VOC family protein [Synechococcus sp. BS55D]TCD57287.1 lactoylglutathione lyase [Synechococcus sp. BS55D]
MTSGSASSHPSLSWVLASKEPKALAAFYASLFQTAHRPGLAATHWLVDLPDGGLLQIYRPSRQRSSPVPGQALAPCLQRTEVSPHQAFAALQRWIADACQLGASIREDPRLESFGAECWLEDPEGHGVLLLVRTP